VSGPSATRPVQGWAQRKRLTFFAPYLRPTDTILEIGSGSGWMREALAARGFAHYTTIDLVPPADIVGDINRWRELGLQPGSFDVIIAFEVVEHVDCFASCLDLLAPGGRMLITTPVPETDWILKITERLGLNQKRTSPHSNLVHLRKVPGFEKKDISIVLGLGQWAVFHKAG
jgi:2-polyprenyl-3-methyl-5-hydroxy-6-metoxy-1,4-benzoquinol methylase